MNEIHPADQYQNDIKDMLFWDTWLHNNKSRIKYNSDGSIDVNGGVDISHNFKKLSSIMVKFNYVSGDFNCNWNNLTTLNNCPNKVGGSFYCSGNKLNNLVGGPSDVGRSYFCTDINFINLIGCPIKVGAEMVLHCDTQHNSVYDYINQDGIDLIHKLNTGIGCKEFIFGLGSNDKNIRTVCQLFLGMSKRQK